MGRRRASIALWTSLMLIILTIPDGNASDTMDMALPSRDGDTLLSSGGKFELGFFTPGSSNHRYVGIWYKKISLLTVVWVANREIPLVDSSGVLKITDPGILVLINGSGHVIWSTNSSRSTWVKNPVAQLLDSGNLVVRENNDENPDNFVWQSFDHPSDIRLPGMKLGWDLVTDIDSHVTSWESSDDPSPGRYNSGIDRHGYPQMFLMTGSVVQYRFGPWNGLTFSGSMGMTINHIFRTWFVVNQNQAYYTYELLNSLVICHVVLNPYGQLQRVTWNNLTQEWDIYLAAPADSCDTYAVCGAFGSCNIVNSPACGCLKGFTPKSPKDWDSGNWSDGCVRLTQLDCKSGDGFIKHSNVKLPDTRRSWYNTSMNLKECEKLCLQDCNCTAYSNLDVRGGGSGCLLWFGDLIDIREFTDFGQDLYVRMASSELGKKLSRVIVSTVLTAVVILSITITLYFKKRRKKEEDRPSMSAVVVMLSSDSELPQPKQPGFFIPRNLWQADSVSSKVESINEMTTTLVVGR
ncbi:hypothetical protein Nepgr_013784 [Nepenthes gracilis]|uniref:Uncharacterized protein n=1 Tax=Nepenthes gracilis TaxID=150966 RepID=A0AAD3SIF3_NEPGR|nr:hypothetical protein Nepgr_013784 [Nepenthes gracilis]